MEFKRTPQAQQAPAPTATPVSTTYPCPGLNSVICTGVVHPNGSTSGQPLQNHPTHVATTAFVVSCIVVVILGAIYACARNVFKRRIQIMPNGMVRRQTPTTPYDIALQSARRSRRPKHPVLTKEELDEMAPNFSFETADADTQLKPDIIVAKPDPVLNASKGLKPSNDTKKETLVGVKAVERSNLDDEASPETENVENLCAICVSALQSAEPARKISRCGHVFHASCVEKWLISYQACCPLCKLVLKERPEVPSGEGSNAV